MKSHNFADLFEGIAAGLMGKEPNPYLKTGPLHQMGVATGAAIAQELRRPEGFSVTAFIDDVVAHAELKLADLDCGVGKHQEGRHLKRLGNCFNRYECRACGQTYDVDSSG